MPRAARYAALEDRQTGGLLNNSSNHARSLRHAARTRSARISAVSFCEGTCLEESVWVNTVCRRFTVRFRVGNSAARGLAQESSDDQWSHVRRRRGNASQDLNRVLRPSERLMPSAFLMETAHLAQRLAWISRPTTTAESTWLSAASRSGVLLRNASSSDRRAAAAPGADDGRAERGGLVVLLLSRRIESLHPQDEAIECVREGVLIDVRRERAQRNGDAG